MKFITNTYTQLTSIGPVWKNGVGSPSSKCLVLSSPPRPNVKAEAKGLHARLSQQLV